MTTPTQAQSQSPISKTTSEPVTEAMIDDYLYQLYDKIGKQRIVRYEEDVLKARIVTSHLSVENDNRYRQHFSDTLDHYRQLTGLTIKEYHQSEYIENIYFEMIVVDAPLWKITAHKFYRPFFHGTLPEAQVQQRLQKLKEQDPKVYVQHFVPEKTKHINMSFGLVNVGHENTTQSGPNSVVNTMSDVFFMMFVDSKRKIDGIKSVTRGYGLQPIDTAYIQALYSPQIHAGMDITQAKPRLKQHMMNTLHPAE